MKGFLMVVFLSFFYVAGNAQKYTLVSPDAKLSAEIESSRQGIRLKMMKGADLVLNLSDLAMLTDQAAKGPLQVKRTKRNTVNEEIKPVIKERSATYRNEYNELVLTFKSDQSLTFRLFNEGIAYRFSTAAKDSLTIFKETLNIQFQDGDSVRFQSEKSFHSAYEQPYEFNKLSELDTSRLCNLPVLVQKQHGRFVMITESDL